MFEMPKSYVDEVASKIEEITLKTPKQYLLNTEQQAVLEEVNEGKNIFITGSKGFVGTNIISELSFYNFYKYPISLYFSKEVDNYFGYLAIWRNAA